MTEGQRLAIIMELRNAKGVIGQLQGVSNTVRGMGKRFAGVGDRMINFGRRLEWTGRRMMVGITLPMVMAATQAVRMALDFDKSMAQVRAAASEAGQVVGEDLYARMKQAALDASKVTVFSAKEIAEGFYELVSAGYSAAESMKMLAPAALFAQAANLKMGESVEFVSKMMHVYGKKGYTVSRITDVVSAAVQKSQAHFTDFTHNISMAIGFASAAGQSFEELATALAIMADRGVPAARAGFQLRAAFKAMISPSNRAKEVLKKLDMTFFDLQGNMKPLSVIIGELREKLKGLTQQQKLQTIEALFSTRAASAMIPLIESSTEEYAKYSDIVGKSAGTTKTMAEAVAATPWAKFRIAVNKFNAIMIELGEKILPVVIPWVEKLGTKASELITWFENLSPAMKKFTAGLLIAVAAMGPIIMYTGLFAEASGLLLKSVVRLPSIFIGMGGGVKMLARSLKTTTGAIRGFGTSLGVLNLGASKFGQNLLFSVHKGQMVTSMLGGMQGKLVTLLLPLLKVAGIIGLVVAALYAVKKAWEEDFLGIRTEILSAVEKLKSAWSDFVQVLDEALAPLGGLEVVLKYVKIGLMYVAKALKWLFIAWGALGLASWIAVIYALVGIIKIWTKAIKLLMAVFNKVRETISLTITTIKFLYNAIKAYLIDKLDIAKDKLEKFGKKFQEIYDKYIKPYFIDKLDAIKIKLDEVAQWFMDLSTKIEKGLSDAKQKVIDFVNSVKEKFLGFMGFTKEEFGLSVFLENLLSGLTDVKNFMSNYIEDTGETIRSDWKNNWNSIINDTTKYLIHIKDDVKNKLSAIKKVIWDKLVSIKDDFKNNWSAIKEEVANRIKGMRDDFKNNFKSIKEDTINWLVGLKNDFKNNWNSIKEDAINWITGLKDDFKNNFNAVKESVKNINWGEIWTSIKESLFGTAQEEELREAGKKIPDNIAQGIELNKDNILNKIIDVSAKIVEMLPIFLALVFLKVGQDIIEWIGQGILSMGAYIEAKGPELMQKLIDGIISWFGNIWDTGVDIVNKTGEGISARIEEAKNWGAGLARRFVEGIKGWAEAISGYGRRIVEWVKNGVTRVLDSAYHWGTNLIQNFINGIKDKIPGLNKAIDWAIAAIKRVEQSYNPALPAERWGAHLIQNYARGIQKSRYLLDTQMASIMNSPAISVSATGIRGGGSLAGATTNISRASTTDRSSHVVNNYKVEIRPGNMITTPGERREFIREIKQGIKEEVTRGAL